MKLNTVNLIKNAFLFSIPVLGLIPLEIKGKRFIRPSVKSGEEGEVFFIKGVDYQPGGSSAYTGDIGDGDVLSDPDKCWRDVYSLQQLGVNTIRVYSLHPELNHDECMTILNNAGIYVILDVNSALDGESLNRDNPSSSYNANYLTRVFKFIEAFKGFPNLLGFFAGNEIINDEDSASLNPPYIRALQRDMKEYISKHSNRTIPVGYSAADDSSLRSATFKYLQCDSTEDGEIDSKSDFFGLNSYEWCSGESNWKSSGYEKVNETFKDAVIPVFFSEYGCNAFRPRTFDEISGGVFGGLINTFSGGLIYEYSEESNRYGVVNIDDDDESIAYTDEFDNLQGEHEKVENISANWGENDVQDSEEYECDADKILGIYSSFNSNFTLPEQPEEITELIENGVENNNTGKIIENLEIKVTNHTIKDSDGKEITNKEIEFVSVNLVNSVGQSVTVVSRTASASSSLETGQSSETLTSSSSDGGNNMVSISSLSSMGLLGVVTIVLSFIF
ncbi:putative 1,3-beta-glucanosyltransferase [Ascoidea rubescens DSM 1968]|uniref:1,3-beta-glucanosyltransferase n=1 Tax=Ascoidea rubescens DSM 1968 TaxID=1344418 RepID=A0A1D2VDV6_9ASCO|nr:glycoside hydrolase family 72 protein [Ascoidea rubescens DSM 1968]ODV59772.1 glycoside hydrolase family 72 protein [Ascoidea rubescens DSM 1968]